MMIELEKSFKDRTGRWNDKSARGHETTHGKEKRLFSFNPDCKKES